MIDPNKIEDIYFYTLCVFRFISHFSNFPLFTTSGRIKGDKQIQFAMKTAHINIFLFRRSCLSEYFRMNRVVVGGP